ncbi:MAG: ABC transporter substrate-binding protein [Panacagrimonas sp.]
MLFGNFAKRASLALAGLITICTPAMAEDQEPIVFGASQALTGVFAIAGENMNSGLSQYVDWLNDNGGIKGRPVKYVFEDTGYMVDRSVATFKKITASHEVPVYYADNTGFVKVMASELTKRGTTLMGGGSFASDLTKDGQNPYAFVSGPTYAQQAKILIEFIASQAREKGGKAKLALVYSDTEFGRDPIQAAKAHANKLGIELVDEIVTKPGSVDVSAEVLKLRRSRPDYVIFQGYVLSPVPEFMVQMRQMKMKTEFMGTFWTSDRHTIEKMGDDADGLIGVMPYSYFDSGNQGPMFKAMVEQSKKADPDVDYRHIAHLNGWLNGMIYTKVIEDTLDAGKELNAKNLRQALDAIQDWDTGGIFGGPVSFRNQAIPAGRVYRANAKSGKFEPISDWIEVD